MNRWAAILLLLAGTTAVAGKVYRWTDEQGQVHFGDTPPGQAAATAVETTGDCLAYETPADCDQRVAKARRLDEQRMQEAVQAEGRAASKATSKAERSTSQKRASTRQERQRAASGPTCEEHQREIRDLDQRMRHQTHTGADLSYLRKRLRELEGAYRKECPAPALRW